MAGFPESIYAISPQWVQTVGLNAYGVYWRWRRFGGKFNEYVDEFAEREHYTAAQWQEYQTQALRELLTYAVEHVPYYKEAFQKRGKEFGDFDLNQLSGLPLLDKETIRKQPRAFVTDAVPLNKLLELKTSGTTGTPLSIYFSTEMHRRWSAAYETRVRRWAGVNRLMSRAMIGGRMIQRKEQNNPPFWRYNHAERQLYLSAFHISPKNAPEYVNALNHYRPDYLVGYASSHYYLARMINRLHLDVIRPKAVLTSSEKLTDEMRDEIRKAYRCEVFDAYSGVEACGLASECEYHRLHVSPDVGILELIDENGHPVKNGETGEIVFTGLLNFEQPLIRYRTGDLAILSDEKCPCGREMPVLRELVGRLEDTVIARDGSELVRFHGIFTGLAHVREGQVIQETIDTFRLRLVVDPGFDADDRREIIKRFDERLGTVKLDFELVDRIERTRRGKFRSVISHVSRDFGKSTE